MGSLLSRENFIAKAKNIHNNEYDYSLVNYLGSKYKVKIICKDHGVFSQTPDNHLHRNAGCPSCGQISKGRAIANNTKYFIDQCSKLHDYKYDYSKTIYTRNRDKIIIICPNHGEFTQMAMSHLAGRGCKSCGNSVSHKETQWLNSLNIPKENRNLVIYINNTIIKPDGFDPNTNTIYEYYGDYWHGNPKIYKMEDMNLHNGKTFRELYDATIKREEMIKNSGYNLIVKWQSD